MNSRRDSIVKGTFVLTLGLGVTKLLSFYRFILPRVFGEEGLGIFYLAYPTFSLAVVLATAGIPVAVSKLVAERLAKDDGRGALRVFQLSVLLLAGLGLFFSVLLFMAAPALASDPRAVPAIKAIAPALFFVAVMSAFRGLFQGAQRMAPTSYSYIVEQIVRVGTMIALAIALLPLGLQYSVAGATFGAVTGAAAGLLFLAAAYWRSPDLRALGEAGPAAGGEGPGKLLREILYLAIPVSLAGVVFPMLQLVDQFVVPHQLMAGGLSFSAAHALYGALSGEAMTLGFLPANIFTVAVAIALMPAVSEGAALGDMRLVRSRFGAGLRIATLLTIPAMVGIYVLATGLSDLIFDNATVGPVVATLAAGLLFVAVQQVTSSVLQGLGRTDIPVINLFFGLGTKLALTWLLVPIAGINGAALGTVAGFLVAAALNCVWAFRRAGLPDDLAGMILRPAVAAGLMALIVRWTFAYAMGTGVHRYLGTLAAVAAGVAVYAIALVAVGGLRLRDLEMVPRYGPRIARLLRRLRLMRR
jgi:stage V sporulation protein B